MNQEQLAKLAELNEANNDATIAELQDKLEAEIGFRISSSTGSRMLQKLKITRKKTTYPEDKVSQRVQRKRVDFWEQIRGVLVNNLVFLDEAGVNLWMVRLFARAVQGQRAYGSRPKRKGENVSLFSAISLKGVVAQTSLIGTTDGITFEAFVSQKLVPNLWEGACVIMDNCSAHKGEEVRKMIEAAGAKLIYLPPYSPDFSPIENC